MSVIRYTATKNERGLHMAIDFGFIQADMRTAGPTRVMIDQHEAIPPRRAKLEYYIEPTVIFVRKDGWTLGAPAHLEDAARRLWEGQWVAVLRNPPVWELESLFESLT